MNKKFWNFGEPDGPNELRLDGPISEDSWFGDEVTPDEFRAELAEHPGDITVWINSPGGDVFAASSIYTALKEHDGRVTVKIEALAASAASIVAMAGDEVLIAPTAFMMIHRAASAAIGNSDEMRATARILDEVDAGIAGVYAERTGQSAEKIERMMEAETWMNAASAVELGFADAILYADGKQTEPQTDDGESIEPREGQAEPTNIWHLQHVLRDIQRPAAIASAATFAAGASADAITARLREYTAAKPKPARPENNDDEARARLALRMKLMRARIGGND